MIKFTASYFVCFGFFLLFVGCTVITYEETRNPEFHFHAEGTDSKIDTSIEGVDVATKRETGQKGESKSAIDADTALSQAGSTLAKTLGDVIMEGVSSKLDKSKVDSDNPITNTTNPPVVAPVVTPDKPIIEPDSPVKPDEPVSSTMDLSKVKWLHTDVSDWPVMSKLDPVKVTSSSITLPYDKAKVWPSKEIRGKALNANPWIFIKQDGTWYAATFEWLRPGQTTKAIKAVKGDHIKKSPLKDFVPKNGETYGFMVSGLARDTERNVQERTNIVMHTWGKSNDVVNTKYESIEKLKGTGFVWKPIAEKDKKVVVLLPKSYPTYKVSILPPEGQSGVPELGNFVGREDNGNRPHYRFVYPGKEYRKNSIIQIGDKKYIVPDPSKRYD